MSMLYLYIYYCASATVELERMGGI